MTGPHLIITAICLTSALLGLWLMRQRTDDRAAMAAVSLNRSADEAPKPTGVRCHPAGRGGEQVTDPVQAVRQACLAMEDEARRNEIDLLRPFSVSVPPIAVQRGPLVALLKSVLQNAMDATPRRGAVICMIKMTANHVHFVISDSSGCAEDGAALLSDARWRTESLSPSKMVAEAMRGRLVHTDHPGEGVVVDIAFERLDVKNTSEPKSFTSWSSKVGNDFAIDKGTAPTSRGHIMVEAAL